MNKELIKKYKVEFDYWLNGGEVLFFTWKWYSSKDNPNTTFNHRNPKDVLHYVINDEYVEFRKSLAEGKEIEYSITDLNGNHIRWVNILEQENSYNIDTKVFNYEFSAYRIKPEEPKFKGNNDKKLSKPTTSSSSSNS